MTDSKILEFPSREARALRFYYQDLAEGLAAAGWVDDRIAYAIRRLDEIDAPARYVHPTEAMEYLSAAAVYFLAEAYGEIWDMLN